MGVAFVGAIAFVPVSQVTVRPVVAQFGASLLLDTGSGQIQRSGATAAETARGGEALKAGDRVQSGPEGRIRIVYSGGSVTTLEDGAQVIVSELRTDTTGAFHIRLRQMSGLTWNRVVRIVAGSGYAVDGPNNAVAEVRGTEFAVRIANDPLDLEPVVTVDLASGVLDVSSAGRTLRLGAGSATSIHGKATPAAPVPSTLVPPPPPSPVRPVPARTATPAANLATPSANPAHTTPHPPSARPTVAATAPTTTTVTTVAFHPSPSATPSPEPDEDGKEAPARPAPTPSPSPLNLGSTQALGIQPAPIPSAVGSSEGKKTEDKKAGDKKADDKKADDLRRHGE